MTNPIPLTPSSAPKLHLDPFFRALADSMAEHMLERLKAAPGSTGPAGRAGLEPLLNVDQVAAHFQRDPRTIRRWAKKGLLPRAPSGRSLRFERAAVERGVVEPSVQPDAHARGRATGAALAVRLHSPAAF